MSTLTTERIRVDLIEVGARTAMDAAERGVMASLLPILAEMQRQRPDQRLTIQIRRRGHEVEGVIIEGIAGDAQSVRRRDKSRGPARTAPRHVIEEWVREKGLRPRDGRRHRNPVTSVAVAIQRSLREHGRLQRGVLDALKKKRKQDGLKSVRGKAPRRAFQLLGRTFARALQQVLRG